MSTIQKLKDEIGKLQKKLNSTKKPIAERNVFESENTKLKAEVEHLTRENAGLKGKLEAFTTSEVPSA